MESPIITASPEPHIPPLPSLDPRNRPDNTPRGYRSFLARLEDERALLAQALDAFRVELANTAA